MPKPHFQRDPSRLSKSASASNNQLHPFPPTRGDGRMDFADLVGKKEIQSILKKKRLEFVATGDTGRGINSKQEEVIEAMSKDQNPDAPASGCVFFLNLGDIIYGPNKSANYANRFYRPNKQWMQPKAGFEGIVFGIPGNHDGEVRDPADAPSLSAFTDNFCQPVGSQAPMAATFGVQMPHQPGPYWWLDAPFVDVIGLYSNAAEDFGILSSSAQDTHQMDWLETTLKTIRKARAKHRKALVFASHHPPYSQGFSQSKQGHPGSPKMLTQMDEACQSAGLWPDMVLSGHSHNYQLYKRRVPNGSSSEKLIPYVIAGTGGIGSQPVPSNINATDPTGKVTYASGRGKLHDGSEVYGYLRVRANARLIQATFVQTISNHRSPIETSAIDLATGQETTPEAIS